MKKYTLQEKIAKNFIVVYICILLLITAAIGGIGGKVYWDKLYQLCEQMVSLNLNILDNQIMEIQKSEGNIAKNTVVKETVAYYNQQENRNYGRELSYQRQLNEIFNLFAQSSEISGAHIIDKRGNYLYSYKESPKIGYNLLDESWYRSLTETISMDTCFVSGLHDRRYLVNETDEKCVSMIMPICIGEEYTFSTDAFLVCDIAMDGILNNNEQEENMQFAILDNNEELYTEEVFPLTVEEKKDMVNTVKTKDSYTDILGQNFIESSIVVSMKSRLFGWKVIGVKQLQDITELMVTVLIIMVVTILAAILLVLYLAKRIAKSVMLPMDCLIEECNRVAAGDYNIKFEEKKSEEISFLSDTIQNMVENIVSLTGKVVEEEKKLSEEKVRVLQHQINPHFLNNVLQTIKALAVEGETEKISRMSTLLGQILAYSVYEPYQNVELTTEMEYLRNYIELQNIRFDGSIFCIIDCEQEAEHVQIPKLTLQPLIENSIEHGYSITKKLIINISAEIESDMVCVIINDNGRGIGEKEFQEVERKLANGEPYQEKSSVGIANVNERLRKIFGREYGVQVLSKNGKGTTVIIRIPKRKDE